MCMSLAIDKNEFPSVFCFKPKNNYFSRGPRVSTTESAAYVGCTAYGGEVIRLMCMQRIHIKSFVSLNSTKTYAIHRSLESAQNRSNIPVHSPFELSSIDIRGVMFKTNGDWILLLPASINSKFMTISLCGDGEWDRSTTLFTEANLKFESFFVVTQTTTWSQLKCPRSDKRQPAIDHNGQFNCIHAQTHWQCTSIKCNWNVKKMVFHVQHLFVLLSCSSKG